MFNTRAANKKFVIHNDSLSYVAINTTNSAPKSLSDFSQIAFSSIAIIAAGFFIHMNFANDLSKVPAILNLGENHPAHAHILNTRNSSNTYHAVVKDLLNSTKKASYEAQTNENTNTRSQQPLINAVDNAVLSALEFDEAPDVDDSPNKPPSSLRPVLRPFKG
jgi:hypothetical protein